MARWRLLYNGTFKQNVNGRLENVKYSLENAAGKIGMSKKSLDDYLLQIRYGKRLGFDFHENKDEGIGKLRTFVKNAQQQVAN